MSGNALRGILEPISLEFQVGGFTGGLAFQKIYDLIGVLTDDFNIANTRPSGCTPPHMDEVTNFLPNNETGFNLNVMTGFYQLAWSDGLVLQSNSGAAGHAYLPTIGLALFDLIPTNDAGAMYHGDDCSHQEKLDYVSWHSQAFAFSDSDGTGRSTSRMTPDGTAGTQTFDGRIVGVGPAQEVEILAEGLNKPSGIDVYPGFTPTLGGVALFFQIDSPVAVLFTAPDGRKIGVDPGTELYVNDFGAAGYDSNTNEPHLYGIRDPPPGDYTIETEGTGTGPYTITIYGANLGTGVITRTLFTGGATPGSSSTHQAAVTGGGAVTNEDPFATLDVDGSGTADPLTDGLLALRYLFGFRGAALVSGAVGTGCTRCEAPEIEVYLAGLS